MTAPSFGTAVPQRRYQLGAFTAVLLGEVESKDTRGYRFILAVLRPGAQQPSLYVTAEAVDPAVERGPQQLCVYDEAGERCALEVSKNWLKADLFAARALAAAAEHFGLQDVPRRLG